MTAAAIAILCGGQSRRFGSDKALAKVAGLPLIERAMAAARASADTVYVCGRDHAGATALADRPMADLGPLGGLNAALHAARDAGIARVIALPVDLHPAETVLDSLATIEGPAVLDAQYLAGTWPSALADRLEAYLLDGGRRVDGWLALAGARRIPDPPGLININRPSDVPPPRP